MPSGRNVIASLAFFMPFWGAKPSFKFISRIYETPLRPAVLRIISVPADCTRSRFGAGRNRYIRIIVRLKLLYAGSAEDQRNAAPPHNPVRRSFAEKQPRPFPYPALRLNTCNFNSIPATDLAEQLDQGLMGPPPHNPVRRSLRYVTGLRGCSHAAQKSKSRLSVAANKSCLQGRTSKIWSCAPVLYGKGTHVCAALTGGLIIAAPFFDWPSSGRRSVFHILQEHSGEGTITTSLRRDALPKLLRFLFNARYSDRNSSGVLHGIGNGSGRQRTVRMSDCRPDIPAIHPVDGVPATVCVRVFS